ncbi:hypothetical protein [Azospirillum endophyticum]
MSVQDEQADTVAQASDEANFSNGMKTIQGVTNGLNELSATVAAVASEGVVAGAKAAAAVAKDASEMVPNSITI